MPSDITQTTDTGEATAVVTWTPANASDNSGSQTLTSSHNPGDLFSIGDTLLTYTSVDPSGNKVIKTFTVTIQGRICLNLLSLFSKAKLSLHL